MEKFIICTRKSKKRDAKKSDNYFYAWFRDPSNGAKLPKNRVEIDTLNHRLYGGIRVHISSKAEAFQIAQQALDKGLVFNYTQSKETSSTPRLVKFVESFWDYDNSPYVKRKIVEGSRITKAYCKKMLQIFLRYCKPCLSDSLDLDCFKVSMMEKIKNSMYDKELSSSSINWAIESIRTPLVEAYRQEIINENIGGRLKVVKRTDREKGILTEEESRKLITHLKQTTEPHSYDRWRYLITAIMYYSGMRNNEVTTLKSDCIEVKTTDLSLIHVRHSYNRFDGVKSTKNGKERTTTIPTELAMEILDYSQRFNPDGFIFFSLVDSSKPFNDKHIRTNFNEALEAIGISGEERERRNLTAYSMRHFFNTSMVNSGLNEVEIRTVTGHSDISMTMHYYHENEKSLQKQAEVRSQVLPYIE